MSAFSQYDEYLSHIKSKDAAEAFRYLVDASSSIPGYECRPKPHGYIKRNYHYFSDGRSLFAFVINQSSLLWYFRSPKRTHPSLVCATLSEMFPQVKLLKSGQITVRINTLAEAKEILRIAFPWHKGPA